MGIQDQTWVTPRTLGWVLEHTSLVSSHQEHTQEVGADMMRDRNVTPEETSQFHLLPFKQIRDEDTGVHECTHTHTNTRTCLYICVHAYHVLYPF